MQAGNKKEGSGSVEAAHRMNHEQFQSGRVSPPRPARLVHAHRLKRCFASIDHSGSAVDSRESAERWYNRAGTTALSSLGYYDPIGLISPRSHHRTSSTALSPPRWYHRAAIIALISPHSHHRDSTTGLSMFALFELFEQVPPCTFPDTGGL
ncbi:hypothetical protein EVAR_22442_1 [Eumeta japonica]|uniref:Uncharacterized protein n=1 Tax=Eumeta variegata TaxID=151549 RepID=A0A4C2A0T6_EUMVA|nr:hypothetical protein EVAR_22442_1 [Eumeta japonica]